MVSVFLNIVYVINNSVSGHMHTPCAYFFVFFQDGVCSPEDVDTAMSKGLGLRYSFMGPFETMHLNATGNTLISTS